MLVGRDVTLRGADDTPDRYGRQPAFVFVAGSETPVQAELLKQGEALVSAEVADKDCAAVLLAAEAEARRAKKGIWADSDGHKKRGKSGRYFGRDRALYGGRGQGVVGAAGGGNDLPEFRTELDTGLCCDYFKAHDPGIRGGRACRLSPSKIDGFGSAAVVEARGGPRIELLRVGQVEVLGGN